MELKADRAVRLVGRSRSGRAGNVDPGMETPERGPLLQASKRPLRVTGSVGEKDCGVPGSIDPGEEKLTPGEQNGGTLSAL